jgi:hypothetical protein
VAYGKGRIFDVLNIESALRQKNGRENPDNPFSANSGPYRLQGAVECLNNWIQNIFPKQQTLIVEANDIESPASRPVLAR